ncbi:unnamed protein product, partial [Mesorhabditis spiculigera]
MEPGGPRRSVEQFEIIEHQVTEERRPADYGQQIEYSPQRHQFSSSSAVNNYGYDIHEVHTSEGGARIVETHGGGPLANETPTSRPGISSALRSGSSLRSSGGVFTVPSPPLAKAESWRHDSSTDHDDTETVLDAGPHRSFVRKDSYKRMQQTQDHQAANTVIAPIESSRVYQPRSQSTLVSNSPRGKRQTRGESCWSRTKSFIDNLRWAFKQADKDNRFWANIFCILLMLLLVLLLFGIMIAALFRRYSVREFLLYPPVCEECRRKNPGLVSAQMPSSVFVHHYSSEQAHFELRGNLPFRSNSFTAVDFHTGYVAIADHALTDSNGRHTTCFLMPLDSNAIPSMDSLMEALDQSDYEIQSNFGWQEYWQFEPEEIDYSSVRMKFSEQVKDCENAKWYLLKQTVHPRDGSCSDCYDFCLPDYAVVRKIKYEDESALGIRRLNCFRLYVPEWGSHSPQSDQWGGHWQYPLHSVNTRRDSDFEWQNWSPVGNHRMTQVRARQDGQPFGQQQQNNNF